MESCSTYLSTGCQVVYETAIELSRRRCGRLGSAMRHHFGISLQLCGMTLLLGIVLFELQSHMLIVMPIGLATGAFLFWIGTRLREGG